MSLIWESVFIQRKGQANKMVEEKAGSEETSMEMYRSCDTTNWVFSLPLPVFLSYISFISFSVGLSVSKSKTWIHAFIALDCHPIYRLVKCDLMPSWIVNVHHSKRIPRLASLHRHCPHPHRHCPPSHERKYENGNEGVRGRVGRKKIVHNQIMPAVAQIWFMMAAVVFLYQIKIYANVNAPINFRSFAAKLNHIIRRFRLEFSVSMQW